MNAHALSGLSNHTVRSGLIGLVAQDRGTTAKLLAYVAEFDARKLFVADGYPSMFTYCVQALHMSEDIAYKRIRAGRAARRFPTILGAVAKGRLHLSAVVLLAPHLTEDTAAELLTAATHKTKAEIEHLLAARFPQPDLPAFVERVPAPATTRSAEQLAPGPVGTTTGPLTEAPIEVPAAKPAARPVGPTAEPPVEVPTARPKVTPLAPERFGVQFTMDQEAHDLLRHAQDLLGHEVPAGDVAAVFKRALQALVPQLERRKFAATAQPRPRRRSSPKPDTRHIPAPVKRAVWARDEGRCTYVSESGHRCAARKGLQFDHIEAFARGGEATVSGIRLLCRAHNQYEAECTYGAEFMRHKRLAAAEARAAAGARAAVEAS